MINIIKRDGSLDIFNEEKIINAINKAMIEVDGQLYEDDTSKDIAQEIAEKVKKYPDGSVEVEDIQNWVEDALMTSERRDVAKAYIRYRYKREIARNAKDDFIKAIREKLDGVKIENQNANVDEHSFGGRTGEASEIVTKQLALDYIVSPMARANHLNNEIYIHDLGSYYVGSHNCLSIPFDELLAKGFNTRQTDVRPAQSINTAFQLVAVIFQLQSLNQFGGVSATHLDWTMVPYVRKSFSKHWLDGCKYIEKAFIKGLKIPAVTSIEDDFFKSMPEAYKYAIDMTERECAQASEGLFHNLK